MTRSPDESAPQPGFSIIVPTNGRSSMVKRLLQSLAEATIPQGFELEILLIDDSAGEERAKIEDDCAKHGAHYIHAMANVREKRNLGIALAKFELILFLDSDCTVRKDLLIHHAALLNEQQDIGSIVGVTRFSGPTNFLTDVIERSQFLNPFTFADRLEFAPWATCSNTSFKKSTLLAVGGFDTQFPFLLGGDDLDLGVRVNQAGQKMRCCRAAVVDHTWETWSKFIPIVKRAFRWGRMDVHLFYRKHTDRLFIGNPALTHVFLSLVLGFTMLSILTGRALFMISPFRWLGVVLLLRALFTVLDKGEVLTKLGAELVADILGLAFEVGTIIEGIKQKEFRVFYMRIRRFKVLERYEDMEESILGWSMWLAVVVEILILGQSS